VSMHPRYLAVLLPLAFAAGLLPAPGVASAEAASAAGRITYVLAAPEPARIDERLEEMATDLKRAFGSRFKRFDDIDHTSARLQKDEASRLDLPGDGELVLTFLGTDGAYLRVRMEMPSWKGVVRVKDGVRFFQAGRDHEDGTLVIAIRLKSDVTNLRLSRSGSFRSRCRLNECDRHTGKNRHAPREP